MVSQPARTLFLLLVMLLLNISMCAVTVVVYFIRRTKSCNYKLDRTEDNLHEKKTFGIPKMNIF